MQERPAFLKDEAALRAHVPTPSERITAKIRPVLEASARSWVGEARIVGIATHGTDGSIEISARARTGVAHATDPKRILLCDKEGARIGKAPQPRGEDLAGALFMLPGLDSTLRVNGALARTAPETLEFSVRESYMHCPKAFIRSGLWELPTPLDLDLAPESGPALGPAGRRFVEASPFLLLGTALRGGNADLSPRGDPPGFVRIIDERTLLIPDRPGNRIADSFRNLIQNPVAGLLFLVPGLDWALRVSGEAHAVDDPEWLAPLSVRSKLPKLGIWLDVRKVHLEPAPALSSARIWDLSAHVSSNRVPTAGRAIVSQAEPGGRLLAAKGRVLDWVLSQDAKRNLY